MTEPVLPELPPALLIDQLEFAYGSDRPSPLFKDFTLTLPQTSRVLLVGANGVGKSTLLRLIAGRHLLGREVLRVFGRSPFYDLSLSSEMALVDQEFPVTVDLSAREMMAGRLQGVDPRRERELLELLEIDPEWRMPRISEGQRRRVQLLLALRRPIRLLLLDEITSQLDLIVRADLLEWLRRESDSWGLNVIYATHILDGLLDPARPWPTQIVFLGSGGRHVLQASASAGEIAEWIRTDRKSGL